MPTFYSIIDKRRGYLSLFSDSAGVTPHGRMMGLLAGFGQVRPRCTL